MILPILASLIIAHSMPRKSACVSELRKSEAVAEAIANLKKTAHELKGSPDFLSPVVWRSRSAKYGLPSLDLPRRLSGENFSARQMSKVFQAAGHLALDLRDVVGAGHARLLLQSNRPSIQSILRTIARGEGYMAIAITEEGAGSDIHAMRSVAQVVNGGYRLTGKKLFNARIRSASHVILFVQNAEKNGRLMTFVVPIDHAGLKPVDLEAHGLLGNSFGGIEFDEMFVPEELRIGDEIGGGQVFRSHFLYWRLMMAAAALGTGQGAIEQVVERLKTRHAFGGPIGRFTHLQQQLAFHSAQLQMAELLVRDAAALLDNGELDKATARVAMAKAEGVEIALAAADFAMKTFGAEGYSTRVDLGQRVIDLMGLRIADGTTDVLRQDVVRHLYGREFWEMAVRPATFAAGATFQLENRPPALGGVAMAAPRLSSRPTPAEVLTYLQKLQSVTRTALAVQPDYDPMIRPEGGGACATATGFNVIQSIARVSELSLELSPKTMIEDAFRALPFLLDGRVSNPQFVDLLNFLAPAVGGRGLDIDIVESIQSASDIPQTHPDQRHVLIYQVFDASGAYVGRHFVILKERSGNDLVVVDPVNPAKDYLYQLVQVAESQSTHRQVRLIRPGTSVQSPGPAFLIDALVRIHIK